jgi:rhodanese-related sulfurtransferase
MNRRAATTVFVALALAVGGCAGGTGGGAVAAVPGSEAGAHVETITAAELSAMLAAGQVVLVDVRTPAEFAEARLAGALNAPLSTFEPASIPQEAGRETILMCRTSRRSAQAADMLSRHLNRRVRHLEGGIVAWQAAGLPTVAEPAPAN